MARKFSMNLEHTVSTSNDGQESHRWVKTYHVTVGDIVSALLAEQDDMFTLDPLKYPKYSMVVQGQEKTFEDQTLIEIRLTEER